MAAVESLPDALEGSVAPRTVDGVDGGSDGADEGVLEKRPEGGCRDAQSSDFVGDPDTDGSSAAGTPMTVAAKNPPRPDRFSLVVAVVKSGEDAVANERADGLAVGTGGLFEPLDNSDPFLLAAVEPLVRLVGHGWRVGSRRMRRSHRRSVYRYEGV